jgi:cytochrome P450
MWIVRRLKGTIHARVAKAQTQLRVEIRALMQEKRQRLTEKPEQQNDIISIILRSGDFSDDYLVDQLLTFLAAG